MTLILSAAKKQKRKRLTKSRKAVTGEALAQAQKDAASRAVQQAVDARRPVAPVEVPIDPKTDARLSAQYLFVTGAAGSGKTFLMRQKIENNPLWGKLTATTGAAARILGRDIQTVNASLHVFDLESLEIARDNGYLRRNLRYLHKLYERLLVDEASMMSRPMFEIIYEACKEEEMGLILSGDFLQLAPVTKHNEKTAWLFESPLFKEFTELKLETQYRQTDKNFLNALNFLRRGAGGAALEPLEKAGVNFWDIDQQSAEDWTQYLAYDFPGTMLVATNDRKEYINGSRYRKLMTPEVIFNTYHTGEWTKADKERWKEIPNQVALKIGARVMVLRNAYDENERLIFANGDTGIVQDITPEGVIVLRDDGKVLTITNIKDDNGLRYIVRDLDGTKQTLLHRAPTAGIVYMPLAQAWATTVHKAQGLTFNHPVCVDIFGNDKNGGNFFGHPAMLYVAISRVRNPKDLTIIGANSMSRSQEGLTLLEACCNMDNKVRRWL